MNATKTKVRELAYIRLYVKARAMLLDYGHLEEVATLDKLYEELMGELL